MALSLAEKALLLQYGIDNQQAPRQPDKSSGEAAVTEMVAYHRVIGALLMGALLQRYISLKRSALFVRSRPTYLVLVFGMLLLYVPIFLGPATAYSVTSVYGASALPYFGAVALSLGFFGAVALSLGLMILWGIAVFIIEYLISGRLSVDETLPTDDALLVALLRRMREIGQAKTCHTYSRRLRRSRELREQVATTQKQLIDQGYLVTVVRHSDIWGGALLVYRMNLDMPECQELRDQFRAFLLTEHAWNEQIAALAILFSPRLFVRRMSSLGDWQQEGWATLFAPTEYPVIKARLKAIKAQRDQTMRAQWGATTYQGLLTIRYGFAA